MGILRFESWCENAVSGIRDRADRERVYKELYAHMEDQYEELLAQRMEEQKAEKAVVAAMGSYADTAAQLEKLYPPIWGRLLLAARLVLVLAFLLALSNVPQYLRDLRSQLLPPPAATLYFSDEGGITAEEDQRTFYAEPMSRDYADGYRFTLTQAAERHYIWRDTGGNRKDSDELYLAVEVYHPSLWEKRSHVLREFYAVDSLGNRYESTNRADPNTEAPSLWMNVTRTGLFSYTWFVGFYYYRSHDADWIELRYDKAGRSVRLRVELEGGGAE
jgi:hypothetical protein